MSKQVMDREAQLELLGKLVSFPSTQDQEKEVGIFLRDYLRGLGIDAELQPINDIQANVIGRVKIGNGGKTVVLNSHMDVVSAASGWETNPFELVVRDGRAYGRGSTDAKGALTAFLTALQRIMAEPGETNGNIIFTAVADEESFSKGARFLADSGIIHADYGIVGEPTMSNVFLCHKGSIRPVVKIQGKSAHASTPELGISAVRVASYISELVDEMQEKLSKVRHPVAGKPSAAITKLRVGVQENILPDTGELIIDRRMVPSENEAEIKQSFEDLCRAAEAKFPGAKVWVDHYLVTTGPASEVLPDSKIAQLSYKACEAVTGVKQVPQGTDCNTDMNHLMRIGIPCVIIGPGTLKVAHKPNEYVDIDQLESASRVVEAVIRAMLAS